MLCGAPSDELRNGLRGCQVNWSSNRVNLELPLWLGLICLVRSGKDGWGHFGDGFRSRQVGRPGRTWWWSLCGQRDEIRNPLRQLIQSGDAVARTRPLWPTLTFIIVLIPRIHLFFIYACCSCAGLSSDAHQGHFWLDWLDDAGWDSDWLHRFSNWCLILCLMCVDIMSQVSGGKQLCSYIHRVCMQRKLDGFDYCIRHILVDRSAPFRQCSYTHPLSSKRCPNAARKQERRDSSYCPWHIKRIYLKQKRHQIQERLVSNMWMIACLFVCLNWDLTLNIITETFGTI